MSTRSFRSDDLENAGLCAPGRWVTRSTRPGSGARFTWTSVALMYTPTRSWSPSSRTTDTRPSAGETAPGPDGRRSGSRKNHTTNAPTASATAASGGATTASTAAAPNAGSANRLTPGANRIGQAGASRSSSDWPPAHAASRWVTWSRGSLPSARSKSTLPASRWSRTMFWAPNSSG